MKHRVTVDVDIRTPAGQFVAVAEMILPQRMVWETRHLVGRAVSEDPALRAVALVSRGEGRVREIEADYHAQDVWETEGGAQAYA